MSKGLASVKTLTVKQIADKWKLPVNVVAKKVAAGVKVEKEHTKSLRQANEIARNADAIGVTEEKNGWAIAISNFKKTHEVEDGKWVKKENKSDFFAISPLLNNLLFQFINFESKLIDKINFPFGTSIIAVAKKK